MAEKPSTPRGTRDFGPDTMVRRNYIFDTIRHHFKRYGFLPIETPAMENTQTLLGKYGEEGDRLIFRILNSGNYLENLPMNEATNESNFAAGILPKISEKALRYDLTVPFARFVVQHQNEISFPFKRYQIQPVWRADRPAKGRFREFYQCDADMIGSNSLLNELELIQLMDDVFSALKIKTIIKINNRKILSGIAEITGETERLTDITVAIDKLDKIGEDAVVAEMQSKGISPSAIEKIRPLLSVSGSFNEKISVLKNLLNSSETGMKGIQELEFIFNEIKNTPLATAELELDITLARGLNYYTGAIFEVKSSEGELKVSITGGGRYDDLTGIFGLKGMSGVGISFGADRIYEVMSDLNLFPEFSEDTTQLLFTNFGEKEAAWCMQLLRKVRNAGINAELYPDKSKMDKQMKYANNKKIPFVALAGSSEMESGKLTLKDMEKGTQDSLSIDEIITKLKK